MTVTRIADLAAFLQPLFTSFADDLAREVGLVRRQRQLSGSLIAQTLVFGWLTAPRGSLEHLARSGAAAGAPVSATAWHDRFTPACAEFLRQLLMTAVGQVVGGPSTDLPLLARFAAVWLVDSTTVSLPAALAALWPGCGGGHSPGDGAAAVKVSVAYDLVGGGLGGLTLASGRTHDRLAAPALELVPGSLRCTDRGYFQLAELGRIAAAGAYFLTRPKTCTAAWWQGQRYELSRLARSLRLKVGEGRDLALELGATERLPVRLLVWRVPAEVCRVRRAALRKQGRKKGQPASAEALALAGYVMQVTNAPEELLSAVEARELYRARWQIELLFKLWKSQGGLAESRSAKPERVLCEVYAKLLAVVVGQWCLQVAGVWSRAARSLVKAWQQVQVWGLMLLLGMRRRAALRRSLDDLARSLAVGCAVNTRKQRPATYQRLAAAAAGTLS